MAIYEWNESLSIKIRGIDDEHKQLFKIFEKLHDAMKQKKTTDELEDIIDGLIVYTGYHFQTEKTLFEKYNYPGKEQHINEHEKIVDRVKELEKHFKESGSIMLALDIHNFMAKTMITHIINEDKKYEEYFHENNIEECL